MLPRVINVKALSGFLLEITFNNEEIRYYDCKPLLDFGVFRELNDEFYFRRAYVLNGTVAWPHEQDICPDTLYMDSQMSRLSEAITHSGSD